MYILVWVFSLPQSVYYQAVFQSLHVLMIDRLGAVYEVKETKSELLDKNVDGQIQSYDTQSHESVQ